MSNRIKKLRNAKGLTLAELAEKIGTSLRMIQYLEAGQRALTLPWLQKIARALNVSMAELLGDETLGKGPSGEDERYWQVLESIIEQARKYPELDKKLLVAIAQAVYRAAVEGRLPTAKGKTSPKILATALRVETARLAEYESGKKPERVN